ncbi:HAD family hydrolase [Actinopolymorpha sp. B17G11]|uniref:HAD family hydrolase n=1 Tax=unclassified Actinopolymorpha TaxID=2627063 RepID=UPI0032D8ED4C
MSSPPLRPHRPPSAGRPRLVASDLDGTLLRTDGTVSPRTRRTLARVEDSGTTVVFATGRPPRWLRHIADATGHRGIAVCSNGALVYDLHKESVVDSYPLAPEIGLAVVDAIRAAIPGVSFGVEFGETFGHEQTYEPLGDFASQTFVGEVTELFGSQPAVKLLAKHNGHDADVLFAKASEVAGDLAELTYSGGAGLLEISAPGVSKATTLAAFCAERGVSAEEVVAFGDMPNDLAMLSWAGTAYAMAGAHPDVLAAVERRCPGNDDDGVAAVLDKLFGFSTV